MNRTRKWWSHGKITINKCWFLCLPSRQHSKPTLSVWLWVRKMRHLGLPLGAIQSQNSFEMVSLCMSRTRKWWWHGKIAITECLFLCLPSRQYSKTYAECMARHKKMCHLGLHAWCEPIEGLLWSDREQRVQTRKMIASCQNSNKWMLVPLSSLSSVF